MSTTTGEDKMRFICKTGIPCIDGDLGGIYSRLIITLNSQPEGGKTRLALAHFAYPVMKAGEDVIFYETELSKGQVMNILIAHHIIHLYGGRYKIPDEKLNKENELTPEERAIYEAAKIDLFESGKYGKFYYKGDCIVEKFKDEVTSLVKQSGKVGLLVIDYMGLAESKPLDKYQRPMEMFEIITELYKITRRLVRAIDMCALCINQFNDKGVDAAYAGKPIRSGYIQGGHIATRHTDYDISMTFTEEQKLANVRMLSNSKKRGTAGFKPAMLGTDLSVSIFRQEIVT